VALSLSLPPSLYPALDHFLQETTATHFETTTTHSQAAATHLQAATLQPFASLLADMWQVVEQENPTLNSL
jgi:hypothetical protein